jgi:protein-disulfide isomerase
LPSALVRRAGQQLLALEREDAHRREYGLQRMGDLTSAPIPAVRADDHLRGRVDDPELVVMYADFSCPRCAVAAIGLRQAGSSVVFRHFALRARHPRAVPLAHAAEAAALQGAFWPFHDAVFADQGRIDDPHLWARCEALGLDVERFEADRRSVAVAERVAGHLRDGMRAGVTATPALLRPSVD